MIRDLEDRVRTGLVRGRHRLRNAEGDSMWDDVSLQPWDQDVHRPGSPGGDGWCSFCWKNGYEVPAAWSGRTARQNGPDTRRRTYGLCHQHAGEFAQRHNLCFACRDSQGTSFTPSTRRDLTSPQVGQGFGVCPGTENFPQALGVLSHGGRLFGLCPACGCNAYLTDHGLLGSHGPHHGLIPMGDRDL